LRSLITHLAEILELRFRQEIAFGEQRMKDPKESRFATSGEKVEGTARRITKPVLADGFDRKSEPQSV